MRDSFLCLAIGDCVIRQTKFDMAEKICHTSADKFRHFLTKKGKMLATPNIRDCALDHIRKGNPGIYLSTSQGEYDITSALNTYDFFRRATTKWPVFILRVDGDFCTFFNYWPPSYKL